MIKIKVYDVIIILIMGHSACILVCNLNTLGQKYYEKMKMTLTTLFKISKTVYVIFLEMIMSDEQHV